MGKVRASYPAREKLTIVKYAEAHGNRAAGREFNVSEACVRRWRGVKDRLQQMPGKKRANRCSKPQFPDVEKKVFDWVVDRRQQGIAISSVEIRLTAIMMANEMSQPGFKGSVDWSYRFMKRHDLSIRRRTHISQKLPEDYDEKLVSFQQFMIRKRREFDFPLSQIGNADQTPLTFDLPYSRTVDLKGNKSITVNTTGNEKNRFTVMLCCTADGGKLPPYVIFKRKTLPKGTSWPKGIHVRCQHKGWMDDELTRDWINTVWGERPGRSQRSLLVLDSFRCHTSDAVKKTLYRDHRTTLGVIPGGLTCMLQPLDVSINKPMKTLLQRKWNAWYSNGQHSFTDGGRMRKPELIEICQWIVDAWREIDESIIVHAFKKCCISNNLDGSEDDVLWTDPIAAKNDEEVLEDFYTPNPPGVTDKQMADLFEDSGYESEFEGFEPWEV